MQSISDISTADWDFRGLKMRIVLKKGKQRQLILDAIKKAGSERKLSKITGVSTGAIYRYKFEHTYISEDNLKRVLRYLRKNYCKDDIKTSLDDNWGQKKGGAILIEKKRKDGTLPLTIEKLKRASSERMKNWHKIMKKDLLEYHIMQYERFKKIGKRTIDCKGVKVRNWLEKQIADFLHYNGINFDYEPCLIIGKKAYFPDFKVGKLLIEATCWSHPTKTKLDYLETKVSAYKRAGYEVVFFIPETHRKFYKQIESTVISDLHYLRRLVAPVA